jgi:hypothetical protein
VSAHHHQQPIPQPPVPQPHHPNGSAGDHFVAVAGRVNGPLGDADDNHVEIKLLVASGAGAGSYKVEFNVESNATPKDAQYFIVDHSITAAELPHEGVTNDAILDYKAMKLQQANFKTISNGNLRTIVHSSLSHAVLVVADGFTFPGNGVHMIHDNNGERPGSAHGNHPKQDGALAVYFKDLTGQLFRRWIFLKFQSQTL